MKLLLLLLFIVFVEGNNVMVEMNCKFEFYSDEKQRVMCFAKFTHNNEPFNITLRNVDASNVFPKNNQELIEILVVDQTMHYLPRNMAQSHRNQNIIKLVLNNTGLKELRKEDLEQFPSLTDLQLHDSCLIKIEDDLFKNTPKVSTFKTSFKLSANCPAHANNEVTTVASSIQPNPIITEENCLCTTLPTSIEPITASTSPPNEQPTPRSANSSHVIIVCLVGVIILLLGVIIVKSSSSKQPESLALVMPHAPGRLTNDELDFDPNYELIVSSTSATTEKDASDGRVQKEDTYGVVWGAAGENEAQRIKEGANDVLPLYATVDVTKKGLKK